MKIAVVFLVAACCLAQAPVEVIALKPDEVVEAKKWTEALRHAREREQKAAPEWDQTMRKMAAAHPEIMGARYTASFEFIVGRRRGAFELEEAVMLPLSEEERTRARSVYVEMTESKVAAEAARRRLEQFKIELLAKHIAPNSRGGPVYVLIDGRQYTPPEPWNSSLVLTPDGKFAVPYIR
jgi:hypothetical protein